MSVMSVNTHFLLHFYPFAFLRQEYAIFTDPEPDGIIDDMLAELRTVPYLLYKGFKSIEYNHRRFDFFGEFENQAYNIEVGTSKIAIGSTQAT